MRMAFRVMSLWLLVTFLGGCVREETAEQIRETQIAIEATKNDPTITEEQRAERLSLLGTKLDGLKRQAHAEAQESSWEWMLYVGGILIAGLFGVPPILRGVSSAAPGELFRYRNLVIPGPKPK